MYRRERDADAGKLEERDCIRTPVFSILQNNDVAIRSENEHAAGNGASCSKSDQSFSGRVHPIP
jgi:hypothetical protein